jgi:hypothetical protein
VSNNDITVGVSGGSGVKISGVVGLGPNSPRPANLRVTLTGDLPWNHLEASVNSSGQFEFPSVPPGKYSILANPLRLHGTLALWEIRLVLVRKQK